MKGADCDCAAWFATKVVLTHLLEGLRVKQLGVSSPACREKHGEIVGHGELIDFRLMDLGVLERGATCNVDDLDLTSLGSDVECFVEGAPDRIGELLLILRLNLPDRFWSVISGSSGEDRSKVIDANECYPLVHVDEEELLVAEAEANLDLSVTWHDNGCSTSAIFDIEDDDTID